MIVREFEFCQEILHGRLLVFAEQHFSDIITKLNVELKEELEKDKADVQALFAKAVADFHDKTEDFSKHFADFVEKLRDTAEKTFQETLNEISMKDESLDQMRQETQLEVALLEKKRIEHLFISTIEKSYDLYKSTMHTELFLSSPPPDHSELIKRHEQTSKISFELYESDLNSLTDLQIMTQVTQQKSVLEKMIKECYECLEKTRALLLLQEKAQEIVQLTVEKYQQSLSRFHDQIGDTEAAKRAITMTSVHVETYYQKNKTDVLGLTSLTSLDGRMIEKYLSAYKAHHLNFLQMKLEKEFTDRVKKNLSPFNKQLNGIRGLLEEADLEFENEQKYANLKTTFSTEIESVQVKFNRNLRKVRLERAKERNGQIVLQAFVIAMAAIFFYGYVNDWRIVIFPVKIGKAFLGFLFK